MPKVSVLMSIYRPDERYLAEQLETIDAQDFDDFEVVVYNDCPEDPSWEQFCREHVTRHPLRYEQGTHNLGYIKAFEHLVAGARGDYLALCDQDDRWLPGRLSQAAAKLDEGYLLVSCDRQIIDGAGVVVVESWHAAHPDDAGSNWTTGEDITARAAFTCYSIGMATMMRTDVAQSLLPFPPTVGHDKWLALGASALGPVANLSQALVQYRRHGHNESGVLRGVSCKQDWYRSRVQDTYEMVCDFARRFPNCPSLPEMQDFAEARHKGDPWGIWRHRQLAPEVARFEVVLRFTPDPLFKLFLALYRRGKGGR